MCEEEDCEYCKGPHHILLCYKKENDEKQKNQSFANKPAIKSNQNKKQQAQPKASSSKAANGDGDDWEAPQQKKNAKK